MEDPIEGEEIDTKDIIQAKKAGNFYLPNPNDPTKTRKDDLEFESTLKSMNTLSLLDFNPKTGTLYIGKIFDNQLKIYLQW